MPDLPSFSPEFEACLGEGGWSLFTGFTVAGRVCCSCWVQSQSFLDILGQCSLPTSRFSTVVLPVPCWWLFSQPLRAEC